jgi:hypothetical protein
MIRRDIMEEKEKQI